MLPPKWWTSIIRSCNPSRGERLGRQTRHSARMKVYQDCILTRRTLACAITLLLLVVAVPPGPAKTIDAERDLSRLQAQAEDAVAEGDPQGAAINIGRAALLASQLGKQAATNHPPYRLMVDLFRTQEQVYRAIALFQQGGERTPVSSVTCSLLSLGRQHAGQALKNNPATAEDHAALHQQTMEWLEIIRELQQDWSCR